MPEAAPPQFARTWAKSRLSREFQAWSAGVARSPVSGHGSTCGGGRSSHKKTGSWAHQIEPQLPQRPLCKEQDDSTSKESQNSSFPSLRICWPIVTDTASLTTSGSLTVDVVVSDAVSVTIDRKSTRLNSSHSQISYAVFCLKNKKICNVTYLS